METNLTDRHELLKRSVQKLLKENYDFATRRAIIASEEGWSREHWRAFAEAGLLAVPFLQNLEMADRHLAIMILMREFGRNLVVEPYFETVVVAGGLIEAEGDERQKREYLSRIASGETIWTLAWSEKKARYELHDVESSARQDGDEYILNGVKVAVACGGWADKFIVSARTSGAPRDRGGVSLFILEREAANLLVRSFRTADGRNAASIEMSGVRVPGTSMLGRPGQGNRMLEACRDRAIVALCAEAVGAMDGLSASALDCIRTKPQVSVMPGTIPIPEHRIASMFAAWETALTMSHRLTLSVSSRETVANLAAAAKSRVLSAARSIGEQAILVHGAIGANEYSKVTQYVRRIGEIDAQFGDAAYHLKRYSRAVQNRQTA